LFGRIVVGYTSDQAGRDAVSLAARLAAPLDCRMTVAFPYHALLSSVTAAEAEERVAVEVRELLDGLAGLQPPVFHWTPSSWPIRGLHELARHERAGLIVFGSARERLADRLHVSLMERMVHGAPCAVAVAPAHHSDGGPRQLQRIGVGFSTSPEGRAALDVARRLATLLECQVELIAGVGLEPTLASYAFASPALAEIEQEMHAETAANLERLASELGEGPAVEHRVVEGDPATVLVERSAELDLLVLGSRAYGPVRHVLLGSVSASAMREAHCPVMVIPRGSQPPADP